MLFHLNIKHVLVATLLFAMLLCAAWILVDTATVALDMPAIDAQAFGCGSCGGGGFNLGGGSFGGTGGGDVNTGVPPPSCTLSLTQSSITAGESSELSWTSYNADISGVSIDNGIGEVSPYGGTILISPNQTVTYILTASGDGGTVTCQATIAVSQPPPAACTLSVTPGSILAGNGATLSWSTSNATAFSIDNNIGIISSVSDGSLGVVPQQTTTYTGTASGPGGSVQCATTVVVTYPAPTCTFSATPGTVTAGNAATLSWSSTNATSVSIDQGIGSVLASGSQTVSPATTKTYTLTATGAGGTVTCAKTVTVSPQPAPTCTLSAIPGTITAGNAATLSWSSANATTASINQGIGAVSASGSRSVSPTQTTTYTLTATGAGGTVTCAKTVTVTPQPVPFCSLHLTASSIAWTSNNATAVTIVPLTASPAVGTGLPLSGSRAFTPSLSPATHTYKMTATGPGGSVICQDTLVVPAPPTPTCTLDAAPASIMTGSSSALSWATTNATSVSIDQGIGSVLATGSQTVSPATTKTYTLTATGAGGTVTCAKTVTVSPQPAPTCTLSVAPGTITAGNAATLSWSSANATTASINQGIGAVSASGSRSVSPTQTTTYLMTVSGLGGSATCQTSVTVNQPPSIPVCTLSLSVSNISWSTQNATSITLTGSSGAPTLPGSLPLSGSYTFNPTLLPGTYTYTLTASGPGGNKLCQDAITIQPPPTPTCTLDASPATIMAGSPSILSWTTTNAGTASLNQGIGAVTPASDGSRSVSPTQTTTYTLTATGAGGTVTCAKTVTVTPQPVPFCSLHLTASSIAWTSNNATAVTIVPLTASPAVGTGLPLSGSRAFTPSLSPATHTYKMTATGPGGSVICQDTLVVPAPPTPTCTLDAAPASIMTGSSSALSWATTNATSVSIDQGIGSVLATGSQTVSPATTKTYTLTATGAGGTVTCAKTVTVSPQPAPTCTLSVAPSNVTSGGTYTLSWTSTNASTLSIDNNIGSVTPASGSQNFSGTNTTQNDSVVIYNGTATGLGGTATCQTSVTVTPLPSAACSLSASSAKITTGQSVTVLWNSSNATSGFVTPLVGSTSPVASGSTTVYPSSDTTFTATFNGPNGPVNCSTFVQVTTVGGGCTDCGGGGMNQPTTALFSKPGEQPLAFVYLSQVPYTGFEAGSALTMLFWFSIALVAALMTYYIMGRNNARLLLAYGAQLFGIPTDVLAVPHDETSRVYADTPDYIAHEIPEVEEVSDTRADTVEFSVPDMSPNPVLPLPARAWPVPAAAAPVAEPSHTLASPKRGEPALSDVIETRAHAAGVLISPEAVALALDLGKDSQQTLELFNEILHAAVQTIPREDGWIMLTSDRLSQLRTYIAPVVAAPEVPQPIANVPSPMVEVVTSEPSQTPDGSAGEPILSGGTTLSVDEAAAVAFAVAVVSNDRDTAYGIVRSMEKDGLNPSSLMVATASVLDRLYRIRKGGKNGVDHTLIEKAAHVSDDTLGKIVETFAHSLDTVYISPFTGVKLALAQVFDVLG